MRQTGVYLVFLLLRNQITARPFFCCHCSQAATGLSSTPHKSHYHGGLLPVPEGMYFATRSCYDPANPQRRSNSYQGFAKYSDDLNRYLQTAPNGLPSQTDPNRAQSFTSGAGQAALAALRMHSQLPLQPALPVSYHQKTNVRRANSLTAANTRSNSLQTYTYHPKGSYTPGHATISSPAQKRAALLNRLSLISSFQPPRQPRLNSLNSQGSFSRNHPLPEEVEEEHDAVVTTKTTKVVDLQGRTQSITTETIRLLPDGSNIIETTTKNMSRSNSLRSNSLLASPPLANYNLTKIEEDLQDFDYNYQLDDRQQHLGRNGLRNEHHPKELGSPIRERPVITSELRANSITNSIDSASRPLKSILKKKESPREAQSELESDNLDFKDASDAFCESHPAPHPYKNFTKTAPPRADVPRLPNNGLGISNVPEKSPIIKQLDQAVSLSPPRRHEDASSNGSIKFLDKVETIPIYNSHVNGDVLEEVKSNKKREEEEHQRNVELYNRALLLAHEKVFGNKGVEAPVENDHHGAPPLSPQPGQRKFSLTSNLSSLMEPKQKKEKKPEDSPQTGVTNSYRYENHHKDFASHSMRDGPGSKQSTRKERAREEKQAWKKKEKEKQEAEKFLEKELKKQEKEKRKSTRFGGSLFKKKKNKETEVAAPIQEDSPSIPTQTSLADAAIPQTVVNGPSFRGETVPIPDSHDDTFVEPNRDEELGAPVPLSREGPDIGSEAPFVKQVPVPVELKLEESNFAPVNGHHDIPVENPVTSVPSPDTALLSPTVAEPVPEVASEPSSETISQAPVGDIRLAHDKGDNLESRDMHKSEEHSFPISVPVLSEITPETTLDTEPRDSFTEDDFSSPVLPEGNDFTSSAADETHRAILDTRDPLEKATEKEQLPEDVPVVAAEIPPETLPTLVSGENGAPVVVTAELNDVTVPLPAKTAVLEPEEEIKEVNAEPTHAMAFQHRPSDNQESVPKHEEAVARESLKHKYKETAHPEVIVKKPSSKKASKFKEKLFKYFVNTYDK